MNKSVALTLMCGPPLLWSVVAAWFGFPEWTLAPALFVGSLLFAWYVRALSVVVVVAEVAFWLYLGVLFFLVEEVLESSSSKFVALLASLLPVVALASLNRRLSPKGVDLSRE